MYYLCSRKTKTMIEEPLYEYDFIGEEVAKCQ